MEALKILARQVTNLLEMRRAKAEMDIKAELLELNKKTR
jgi:hypothetical protein